MKPNLNVSARSILFLMPAGSAAPFQVRLGLQTNSEDVKANGDFTITDCNDVTDAVNKTMALIEDLNISIADDFTLVLPMFTAANSEQEAELINTAWIIKEEADKGGWEFSRLIPSPIF
ncbi:MAG: hypothetical protein MK207_11760 [Saprospiraceae bacterium]|nr:hypothetical protein [Saprospiraceae bacterium]MCH2081752.1 hypothetical protein [Saprospiraceae bacterium]